MRHAKANKRLGRSKGHRRSLFRNQLASLIENERIVTTLIKAKELRPIAEKCITQGKSGTVHARRLALRMLRTREQIQKLFDDIAPRMAGRLGGYTRITKLGPRPGDGAEMAVIELVDYDPNKNAAE